MYAFSPFPTCGNTRQSLTQCVFPLAPCQLVVLYTWFFLHNECLSSLPYCILYTRVFTKCILLRSLRQLVVFYIWIFYTMYVFSPFPTCSSRQFLHIAFFLWPPCQRVAFDTWFFTQCTYILPPLCFFTRDFCTEHVFPPAPRPTGSFLHLAFT